MNPTTPQNADYLAECCPCKWCGAQTHMTGTQECDPCWHLRTAIYRPDVGPALKIVLARFPEFNRTLAHNKALREALEGLEASATAYQATKNDDIESRGRFIVAFHDALAKARQALAATAAGKEGGE